MASTIVRSPYPDVDIPDLPLTDFVLQHASKRAERPALIDGPTGRTLTYGQLAAMVGRMAGGLAARGLGKGDVLAIYCPNLPEYAVAFYAVAKLGGVSTTVNPLYTTDELAFQLNDARARFLLTIPQLLDRARGAAARSAVEELFVLGEGAGATPVAELLQPGRELPEVAIDPARDVVVLPYSSGTTGLPKGVMLTHRNLVANLCQGAPVLTTGEDETVVAILPFFHSYGLTVLMGAALWQGATLVTMPRFELEQFLRILQDCRITRAFVAPPLVLALAKHPAVDHYDLSSLATVISGAAPLDAELQQACAKRIGCFVCQGYGLTETSPVAAATALVEARNRPGSVGELLPNTEGRIVDPASGADLGRGETGELLLRGPQVMKGFLNRSEATAEMLDADGWLHTGDLGWFDDDGYLYVVDRVKELIKYKGMQVAPAELEAVLLTHPGIADAAVVRFPDPEAGEVPKAFVVARPGPGQAHPGTGQAHPGQVLSAEEVMAFVAERVAPYKRIRRVEFVDQIPKSASGKVLRRVLIARDQEAAKRV